MQELRLVAVSEDGSYAVLVVPGRSGRFALPIDERLRTVARGQFSRLAQYEIEVESPLRPKEIQDRIRAGETAEEIADAAGLPVDRIRRFEGPPLAERARWAQEAQRATVRSRSDSGPGPRLGDVVTERLADLGASQDDVEWDSRKRGDGSWQVQLAYTMAGRLYLAEWVYDVRSKHVTPDDDEAVRLCLDQSQWPGPRPVIRSAPTATVTPIGSRAGGHQQEGRSDADRSGGRGISHPSRQAPAAAGSAAAQQGQVAPAPIGSVRSGAASAGSPADGDIALTAGTSARAEERESVAVGAGLDNSRLGPAASVAVGRTAVAPGRDSAAPDTAAEAAASDVPAEAAPAAARPAKRSGKSRRSSVPSWDEIMFGNSRQPE